MKRIAFSLNVATALVAGSLIFASCGDNVTQEPPVQAAENLVGGVKNAKILDAAIDYTITGPVIVEEGGELTIPAGTTIKAQPGFSSYILVLQGGKININGTADRPVKITSAQTNPQSGDWGGLIINGRAPITGYVEGNTSTLGRTEISNAYPYGGSNAADNSGVITYLILEYTGARTSVDVEHNGLTLNGVGNGTKIENVLISYGADDGIEFYGGTVDVTGLLVVDSDDDMFDFTQGYCGHLRNAYGIWQKGFTSTEKDPRGIEGDGNLDGQMPEGKPQSNCRITNVTFDLRLDYVATGAADFGQKAMQDVIKIRRGAKATITNAYLVGTGHVQDLVDFTDGAGAGDAGSVVNLVNNLTTPASGTNPDRAVNPATGYNVNITTGTTGGCPTDIFNWTKAAGYKFF